MDPNLMPRSAVEANTGQLLATTYVRIFMPLQIAVLVEALLYGIHLLLFLISLVIFHRRRRLSPFSRTSLLIPTAVTLMFLLSTADVVLSWHLLFSGLPRFAQNVDLPGPLDYPKLPIFVANNFIADLLLLHRCYIVWGGHKYVVMLAVFLLLLDTVWGWVSSIYQLNLWFPGEAFFSVVYYWTAFAINGILALLTAGRIYYVARQASRVTGNKQVRRKFNTAVAILVQSAAIYSITLLIYAILISQGYNNFYRIFSPTAICMFTVYRIVAIMPTLMVVQVELGRISSSSSRDQFNNAFQSDLRFNHADSRFNHADSQFVPGGEGMTTISFAVGTGGGRGGGYELGSIQGREGEERRDVEAQLPSLPVQDGDEDRADGVQQDGGERRTPEHGRSEQG